MKQRNITIQRFSVGFIQSEQNFGILDAAVYFTHHKLCHLGLNKHYGLTNITSK